MAQQIAGKIYKIVSPNTDKIYIGSTTRTLPQRMQKHMCDLKSGLYSSKIILDAGNATIELIEVFNCDNRKQLHQREGYYMKQYEKVCINKHIAGRTQHEYRNENKELVLSRAKKYRDTHKEQIAARDKQYRETQGDRLIEKKKQYRETHRYELNEKAKQYYQINKKKILEQNKENVKCECGFEVTKQHLKRHQTTSLHKRLINLQLAAQLSAQQIQPLISQVESLDQ